MPRGLRSRKPTEGQMPLFTPTSLWQPPNLSELPSWKNAKRVAIDIETKDPHLTTLGPGVRRDGKIIGVSFALEDGPSFYLPFGHTEDNLDREKCLSYIRDQSNEFTGDVCGTSLQYDLDYLFEEGITFPKKRFFRDVQIAEALLDEMAPSYSLENIGARHGIVSKDMQLLREAAAAYGLEKPRAELYKLPGRYVAEYAQADVVSPLLILRKQELELEDQDLWNVYDLESRVLPVLVKIRRRGIRVNSDKLDTISAWANEEIAKCISYVNTSVSRGAKISAEDLWKAEAIARPLLDIGVRLNHTSNGGYSVRKDVLSDVDHPIAEALLRARKFDKLVNTFVKSVRTHMVNGRIHCSYNQLRGEDEEGDLKGAAWGRLSCNNPNLQQQPGRDEEIAKVWRDIYEAEEDSEWCSADYSQQEPRWVVHYAALYRLPRAREAAQRYIDNPSTDSHQMMSDLTGGKVKRKSAKEIFLGLSYGMGGAKMCRRIGFPTEMRTNTERGFTYEAAGPEGQAVLDAFDAEVPYVRKMANKAKKLAEVRGYVRTHSGRKCRFPKKTDGTYDWAHKALNRVIQGSSGDQIKTAMVDLDDAGFFLQLQVHDELGQSIQNRREAEQIKDIMESAVQLLLPMKVDIEIGKSWGDSM